MTFLIGSLAGLSNEYAQLGISEGGKNQPNSEATAPVLSEIKAITAARQGVTSEQAIFDNLIVSAKRDSNEISQRISALSAKAEPQLNQDLVESAFKSTLAKYDHDLVTACADEMTARATLNAFMQSNDIKSPALYPLDKLFHFSLLILAVALETAFNAVFYEGSAGLLGGAIVALSVSVANISVAAVLGALFRYAHLPLLKNKIVGYGSLAGFLILGLVLNLIFATFRVQYQLLQVEVISSDITEPTTIQLVGAFRVALTEAFSVFQYRFPEIDFMSLLLFFVGFACSILAFWKGYTYDSRHPGHGEIDRTHKAANRNFLAIKDNAFAEALREVKQTEQVINELRSNILNEQMNIGAVRAKAQSAQVSFASIIKTIQNELDLVIDTYRASNRATRTTAEPEYFKNKLSVIPDTDGSDALTKFLIEIQSVERLASNLAEKYGKALEEKVQQIQHKTNVLVQQEFQNVLNGVRTRATDLIVQRSHSLT